MLGALIWFFPLYWAIVTSLKSDSEVVSPASGLLPKAPTIEPHLYVSDAPASAMVYQFGRHIDDHRHGRAGDQCLLRFLLP